MATKWRRDRTCIRNNEEGGKKLQQTRGGPQIYIYLRDTINKTGKNAVPKQNTHYCIKKFKIDLVKNYG